MFNLKFEFTTKTFLVILEFSYKNDKLVLSMIREEIKEKEKKVSVG